MRVITSLWLPVLSQSLAFGQGWVRCACVFGNVCVDAIHLCFVWLHTPRVLRIQCTVYVFMYVCACVYVYVCVCRLDGAHRVRRCCRALLTAAGNQSTLSVYSPTRRFLNDLP